MKRKKSVNETENVVDFKVIMDQKKMNDICSLDYDEFKSAVTQLLLSIVEAMGENNKEIDKSFQRLIEHLNIVSEELKFIKQVLYMERILNGEHRDGPMTMDQKESMAKSFGIDFDKFVKQFSDKERSKKE
ncbi:MAG: hypothetical protein NTW12_03490 [Deltaproteobacteria bacterium]|nr:hypothetical protein [Deltaproteobacteria bacterium]